LVIKVGIIGVSFGADFHLPAFLSLPGVQVIALADGGSGRAARIARQLLPVPQVFDSGEALIALSGADVVSVATPPQYHAPLVMASLDAGIQVMCEKPFGLTLADADRMATAAKHRPVNTAVGYEMRYDRGIAALADAARRGLVGVPERLDVTWMSSGGRNPSRLFSWRDRRETSTGILGEFASHVFDYAPWLMASPIVEVAAKASTQVTRRIDAEGLHHEITAPDTLELDCRFGSGATGHIAVSNVASENCGHRIELAGSYGRLVLHLRPPFRERDIELGFQSGSATLRPLAMPSVARCNDDDTRRAAMSELVSAFLDNGAESSAPSFQDAFRVQQVIAAVQRSIETGHPVRL
jgi:predicted dehydrogenase